MPYDKVFGYMRLTFGRYSDLCHDTQLAYIILSGTTPEDHLIILCVFLEGNKAHTTSSSIQVQVNWSWASIKLHLSYIP